MVQVLCSAEKGLELETMVGNGEKREGGSRVEILVIVYKMLSANDEAILRVA
jgi:hypothetical protein